MLTKAEIASYCITSSSRVTGWRCLAIAPWTSWRQNYDISTMARGNTFNPSY